MGEMDGQKGMRVDVASKEKERKARRSWRDDVEQAMQNKWLIDENY